VKVKIGELFLKLYFITVFGKRIFIQPFVDLLYDSPVIFGQMRINALAAVFGPVFRNCVIAAAIGYGIKGAIAKKAIEIVRIDPIMTGEIATVTVAEKLEAVFGHENSPKQFIQ
jgi:hypothetical protein